MRPRWLFRFDFRCIVVIGAGWVKPARTLRIMTRLVGVGGFLAVPNDRGHGDEHDEQERAECQQESVAPAVALSL